MNFKLSVAKWSYSDKKEMDRLSVLGFKFKPSDDDEDFNCINKDIENGLTIEIKSMEELQTFIKTYGGIIIEPNKELIIYNGYVEN